MTTPCPISNHFHSLQFSTAVLYRARINLWSFDIDLTFHEYLGIYQ